MKVYKLSLMLLLFLCSFIYGCNAQEDMESVKDIKKAKVLIEPVNVKRATEIAMLLPQKPSGLGKVYKDRSYWNLFKDSASSKVIAYADDILKNGFQKWDDKEYLAYFTKGDSEAGKKLLKNRLRALMLLTWAECLTNNSKYVKAVNDGLLQLAKQKSWVNSSSDKQKLNYNQKHFEVDLSAAYYAHNIAQVLFILDDKIDPTVRNIVIRILEERVFNPVLNSVRNEDGYNNWLTKTSNWNPVCLSGVVGAALTIIPDRNKRAEFVAIAERYIQNYIDGFLDDGYCTEGISYYNYGMTHYIWLREVVWEATSGNVELYNSPKINKILDYSPNMEIINGVYPAIADCKRGTQPNPFIAQYIDNLYGKSLMTAFSWKQGTTMDLVQNLIEFGHKPVNQKAFRIKLEKNNDSRELRSYFNEAGLLIVRDIPGNIGVAMKGGNNNEHHNHNDLGSYTIVLGKDILVEDPGAAPYNSKTFSADRYTIKTNSSYGHPVPLVAGKQQIAGLSAQAKIEDESFNNGMDEFKMDLKSAYGNLSELSSLERTFKFDRNTDNFLVIDEVRFSKANNFETSIISRADVNIINNQKILLKGKQQQIFVSVEYTGIDGVITSEKITDEGLAYSRIRIYSKYPILSGTIKLKYSKTN